MPLPTQQFWLLRRITLPFQNHMQLSKLVYEVHLAQAFRSIFWYIFGRLFRAFQQFYYGSWNELCFLLINLWKQHKFKTALYKNTYSLYKMLQYASNLCLVYYCISYTYLNIITQVICSCFLLSNARNYKHINAE